MAAIFSDYKLEGLYFRETNNANWIYKEFINISDFNRAVNLYKKAIGNRSSEQAQEVAKKAVLLSFPFDDYETCTATIGNLFEIMEALSIPNDYLMTVIDDSPYSQLCLARILNLLSLATSKITTAIECTYNKEHFDIIAKMTKLFCLFDGVSKKKDEIAVGTNPTTLNYTCPKLETEYNDKIAALQTETEKKIKNSRIVTTIICGAVGIFGSIYGIAIGAALGYFLISKIPEKKLEEKLATEIVQIRKNRDNAIEKKVIELKSI